MSPGIPRRPHPVVRDLKAKGFTAGEEVGVYGNGKRRGAAVRASRSRLLTILICAATGSVAPLFAQNAGRLPTVNEVLERYVEATGGREALLRHKSMTVHGRYQDPAHKADYETVFYTKDGKMLLRAELGGGKQYQTGFNGETAWVLHPDGKVDIAEGDVLKTVARDVDMYYHLHVLNYFKSMEVVDVKEFNGRPCYHLKGINNWDKVNEQFYDKENGLLIGYAFNTAWRGGKGDATDTFEEYKDFGGVRMAAKTTSRDGNDLTISLITTVTYDDVKDEVFALPKAVKVAMAPIEFDHVWIMVSPNAPERAALQRAGLQISPDINRHDGQGTASITVEFENAFLELMWPDSTVAVRPGLERAVEKFRHRMLWRSSGWCPIGIGFRRTTASDDTFSFPTWSVTAPWLPEGSAIEMLTARDDTTSPSLFISPRALSDKSEQAARASRFHHPVGVHRITGVLLISPKTYRPIEPLSYLNRMDVLGLQQGEEWAVELTFDDARNGKSKDLRPDLPLVIRF